MTSKTLIIHSNEQKIAEDLALELEGEVEIKKNHLRIHTSSNFDINNLRAGQNVDLNIFNHDFDYRQIKLMVSDMDSTLISIETIDEVAREVGLYNEISFITDEAMLGNLDFTESFKKRLSILKGVKTESFDEVFNEKIKLNSGAAELIHFFNSRHIKTALISGGLSYFAKKIKNQLEMDAFKANEVEIKNKCITGRIIGSVIGANEKANYIDELCSQYNLKSSQVIAIGDGANDIEMMKKSGISVAFKGKPALKKICEVQINHGGLDSLIDFF